MREFEIIVDTDEIKEFFLTELINRGYVPTDDEIDAIADIVFEYMVHKGIIEEEFNWED
jgi:hypothetical protein